MIIIKLPFYSFNFSSNHHCSFFYSFILKHLRGIKRQYTLSVFLISINLLTICLIMSALKKNCHPSFPWKQVASCQPHLLNLSAVFDSSHSGFSSFWFMKPFPLAFFLLLKSTTEPYLCLFIFSLKYHPFLPFFPIILPPSMHPSACTPI